MCFGQVYLTRMYTNLCSNPAIQMRSDELDWRFWDIHVGPSSVGYRRRTRALVEAYLADDPEQIADLARGYAVGRAIWTAIWELAYEGRPYARSTMTGA